MCHPDRFVFLLLVLCFPGPLTGRVAAAPLKLAAEGKTDYTIILGARAAEAERYASRELAFFLKEMTGADFPVKTDDTPPSDGEIILGRTNRFDFPDLPPQLQPQVPEGFAILRQGAKLLILGKIPRATLYGVYDFLEVELGCRFLAPRVHYVPRRRVLAVDLQSRKYDPPLEYRNIYVEAEWGVRQRLNACWSWVPLEKDLGGVRFVGPSFCHTFAYLAPPEQYFDQHPEYYALVDGKRLRTGPGSSTPAQLCLTNPDVLRTAVQAVQEWIEQYRNNPEIYHPDSQLLVSVSPNDGSPDCQCETCQEVNAEEGSPAGTLIRFVNAVAAALEPDYPQVRVETLAYGSSETPPRKTRPHRHIVIRLAPILADFGRALDDPRSPDNQSAYHHLIGWSRLCDSLYVWNYYCNFHAYFKPFPNLRFLDHNIRVLQQHGVRGLYAQSTQTPGGELSEVRHYLLAQCLWRPDTDGQKTMEEFCRLYYGRGGEGVLEYVRFLHDYFDRQNKPLKWNDASWTGGVVYDDDFLARADALLERAEAQAEAVEEKQRVAVVRLSIWYLMLEREFGRVVARPQRATPEALRTAGRRFLEVSQAAGVTHLSEFYGPPGEQLEKEFYPKIQALLSWKSSPTEPAAADTQRGVAAFLSNSHRTFSVVPDNTALEGSCVYQTADREWTLGQAIRWDVTDPLKEAENTGRRYQLRVRVKVARKGDQGPAFRFGYAYLNADYSGDLCAGITVNVAAVEQGVWQWFSLPDPLQYRPAANGQFAFVWASNNPDNVERVYVDTFELVAIH